MSYMENPLSKFHLILIGWCLRWCSADMTNSLTWTINDGKGLVFHTVTKFLGLLEVRDGEGKQKISH
jgi:hypothetical protein